MMEAKKFLRWIQLLMYYPPRHRFDIQLRRMIRLYRTSSLITVIVFSLRNNEQATTHLKQTVVEIQIGFSVLAIRTRIVELLSFLWSQSEAQSE